MEKPILFNTEMVQAILTGKKTQTRRVIKQKYENADIEWFTNKYGTRLVYAQNDNPAPVVHEDGSKTMHLRAMEEINQPYNVGDILWVRETWAKNSIPSGWPYDYKASPEHWQYEDYKWKPSIHMPRAAARLFLKVKSIRAERLQDIKEEDALAEGASKATYDIYTERYSNNDITDTYKDGFHKVWDSCYMWPKSWINNPWIWVIEFEKVEG